MTDFKPGIWYNMEPIWADHLFWNGMSGHTNDLLSYFDNCIETMRRLPDGEALTK